MERRRNFLFLQSNATWFFLRLGKALAHHGHGVRRINFSAGDRGFWGDWNAINWRQGLNGLDGFLNDVIRRDGIDALLLFGDCRPIHLAAISVAKAAGIDVWVFEEGYLRPHWVTLEKGGVNGNSRLPNDPDWYHHVAASLPQEPEPYSVGAGTRERILYDFQWQFRTLLGQRGFPGYFSHRPYPILAEYATWARRLTTLKLRQAQARAEVKRLQADRDYFLFPLQLDSDYQIRAHSPFDGIQAAIEAVMRDFARSAPPNLKLIIKAHPLDNGWINYRRLVARLAGDLGLGQRIRYIDGGDLGALIRSAKGTVTINSTVGFTSLASGEPTMCLGRAIYDVPGLTDQGPLANFWVDPTPPSSALFAEFSRVVQAACLVNGNYYTPRGMLRAVQGTIHRLHDPHDILSTAPPRSFVKDRLVPGDVRAVS